jgi:hypothetical protein
LHVLGLPERYRTNRPTIDPSCPYTSEESTVETPIAAVNCLPANCWVQLEGFVGGALFDARARQRVRQVKRNG